RRPPTRRARRRRVRKTRSETFAPSRRHQNTRSINAPADVVAAGRAATAGRYNSDAVAIGPGSRLGPYEVLSTLGVGGMGEVYQAKDSKLGRDVALKIVRSELSADEEHLARLRREAHILASLN